MTRNESRRIRQARAADAFNRMRAMQTPEDAQPAPALTVLPSPIWIIRWRKSAVRLLDEGRGFELVDPGEGTRFSHRGAAILACKDYGMRGSDYLIVEAPESPTA